MNLPNVDGVEIASEKITAYLLNPRHPDGAGKGPPSSRRKGSPPRNGTFSRTPSAARQRAFPSPSRWILRTERSISWRVP